MVNTRSKTKKMKQAFMDYQSSEALVGSNDDLLTEILLRLPVKSILRLKSVSKHWLWLLSHKDFTNRYDKQNLSESAGLFSTTGYAGYNGNASQCLPSSRWLNFCFDRYGIRIKQSCNGLLLCCSDYCGNDRGARKYYVFNPTTKQFAIIPSVPGGQQVRKTIWFMGLAYHPRDCVHYKLVCIRVLDPHAYMFQIQIFSSDTRKWKISVESFFANRSFSCLGGVYWNGAVHWKPSIDSHLYFKLDVEQLQTLPLPAEMTPSDQVFSNVYLGESRGHLNLTVYRHGLNNPLNVYEMLSDRSGWFIKYQIQLDGLTRVCSRVKLSDRYDFCVIDVVRGEEEEEEGTFLVLMLFRKIVIYNVHDKSFKPACRIINSTSNFHRHIESLTSF